MGTVRDIREDLQRSKDRFLEVMRLGDGAVSECDQSNGYDADYYLNRYTLLGNRIISYNRELKKALNHGEQLFLF